MLADLTDRIEQDHNQISPDDFIPEVYASYSLYEGRRCSLPFDGDCSCMPATTLDS